MVHPLSRRLIASALYVATFPIASPEAMAVEFGPQGVVRQFCQADALGQRVTVAGWPNVAPLVAWSFEPAWDHAYLNTAYEVGSPHPSHDGALAVDVHYSVVGQLSALGLDSTVYVDTVTFEVAAPGDTGWRIFGPPPPPHIFGDRVDIEVMRRSLADGGVNFVSNTLFVWQMFRAAGWNVAYQSVADLPSGEGYRPVERPVVGDLVVYMRDDLPYHVGILEADGQLVSSTINAGILRSRTDAFAGDLKYLRLVAPESALAEEAVSANGDAAPAPTPSTPAASKKVGSKKVGSKKVSSRKVRGKKVGGKKVKGKKVKSKKVGSKKVGSKTVGSVQYELSPLQLPTAYFLAAKKPTDSRPVASAICRSPSRIPVSPRRR